MARRLRDSILPLIAYAAATVIPGGAPFAPAAAAAVSGGQSYARNHNIGQALASAGGSYLGSRLGGSLMGPGNAISGGAGSAAGFGSSLNGTIGNALNSNLGSNLAQSIGSVIGPANVGANLGSTLGSFAGSSIGSDFGSALVPQKAGNAKGEGVAAFKPSRENEQETPFSLRSLGSLSPDQMSSNIATGGVYGGGQGPQEQDYFLNMMNRRFTTDQGQATGDTSTINPIESSYLSQLGLGGYSNARDLLEAISRRRQQA